MLQSALKIFFLFLMLISFVFTSAQERKSMRAVRITSPPVIDGVLSDSSWAAAEVAKDFIQYELQPGQPSQQKTEVRFLYDDEALYVGAELFETAADSILRELSTRDNEANSDLFGVLLDTYNDDINAYGLYLTAAGTQIDARYSSEGQDFDWNAVWSSSVKIHDKGWTVEMKIPYSALRFSKAEVQTWGLQIMRKIRRYREMSFWNFYDPKIEALVRQFGDLTGFEKIKPPVRLSLSPYIAGIVNHYDYNDGVSKNLTYNLSGGMDIKYGLSDAFTLDMTLVPDFSQVQSDNQVLNLSPFEVQFQERRPFFTEGTELFNKGGLFYSRRVGGTPVDYSRPYSEATPTETVVRNPSQTQLINATKISGRTQKKLGVGLFNAVSRESYALLRDNEGQERHVLTSPLTNYNIVVFDQALKNNSFFNVINTNVTREGDYYDANVSGAGVRLNNKKNTFTFGSSANTSLLFFPNSPVDPGYAADLDFGKNGGNFKWSVFGRVKSDRYDPNDLGILLLSNNMETGVDLQYNVYKPFWKVNNVFNFVRIIYQRMYNPSAFWNLGIYGNSNTTFSKRFITCGLNYGIEPVVTYDYYEPRIWGRFYRYPVNYSGGGFISSDYRKPFALDVSIYYRDFNENERTTLDLYFAPRYRVNNRLSFVYELQETVLKDDIGFVHFNSESSAVTFGRRNIETVNNIVSSIYKFSNKMSLSFRLRHYWSKARYSEYYRLGDDGGLNSYNNYENNHNVNFNAFNIDMVFFWQFAPGSELNVVWKNAVLRRESEIIPDYYSNFRGSFSSNQNNMISVKVLYYIDYLTIKKLARKNQLKN